MQKLKILKTSRQLTDIYKIRYEVFIREQEVLNSSDKILFDAWDEKAINVAIYDNDEPVGGGRIIPYSNELEFRVSSSINLKEYFTNLKKVAEISGLCIKLKFRNQGFGNTLHFFRLLICIELGIENIIASCSEYTLPHLLSMGFTILIPEFNYVRYNEKNAKSVLLSFDCKNKNSIHILQDYMKKRINDRLFYLVYEAIRDNKDLLND